MPSTSRAPPGFRPPRRIRGPFVVRRPRAGRSGSRADDLSSAAGNALLSRTIAARASASRPTLSWAPPKFWNSITITKASRRPKSDATTPRICDETSASNPSLVTGTTPDQPDAQQHQTDRRDHRHRDQQHHRCVIHERAEHNGLPFVARASRPCLSLTFARRPGRLDTARCTRITGIERPWRQIE